MAKVRVFFLHGFLGLPADAELVQSKMKTEFQSKSMFGFKSKKESDFEWHSVDFMGSDRLNSKVELKDWGKNFCEAIQALPDQSATNVLLGYSMGGRLAQMAFVENPDLFSKLICISSHVGLSSELERKERYKSDQIWAFRFMREKFDLVVKDWNAQAVFSGSKAEPKRAEKNYSKTALMDCLLRWSLSKQDFSPQVFLNHKDKIFWIVGEADSKYVSFGKMLMSSNYIRDLLVIPKASHRVLFDEPKALAQALDRILAN